MNSQKSGIEIVIDTSSLDKVANKANAADKSLDGVADSANRAERAISGIGAANVDINVDDTKVRTAQGLIDNLSQTETVDINADDAKAQTALDQVSADLEALKALAVIDIVLSAASFATSIPDLPFVSTLIEIDTLTAKITGRVGAEIPGAAKIIESLYTNAWGESREQIAAVLTQVSLLGVKQDELQGVTELAFRVADVSGKDPTEVLSAMDKLVKNQIVPDFETAANFLALGFQKGFDRSGDYLDTIEEYSSVFADAGLTAAEIVQILDAGLKAGARDTDKIADTFKEMFNLTKEEVSIRIKTGDETDRTKALDEIGQFDEATLYAQGQLAGGEFARGVLEAIQAEQDPATQRRIALAIFGPSMVEDLGLPTLLAMDIEENSGVIEAAWDGVAVKSSDAFNNTIESKITELGRTIESELSSALNDAFDVQGVIDRVKVAIPEIAAAIREGKSISQALEEGFDLEGDPLQRLESIFNNIAIGFLEAIQSVLEVLGKSDEAASLGAEITRISTGQFDFDLRLASDGAGLRDSIQTAIDRGVDPAMITDRLQNAAEDMLARGDLAGANTLIDQLKEQATIPIVYRGVEYAPGTTPEEIQARNPSLFDQEQINAEIDKLFSVQNVDTTSLEENAQILADMYTDKLNAAIAEGDYSQSTVDLAKQVGTPEQIAAIQLLADNQAALATATTDTATATVEANTVTSGALEETAKAVEDYSGRSETELAANVDVWANWEAPVVKTIANVDTKVTNLTSKIGSLNTALGGLGEAAVPEEPSATPHASGGTAYGRSLVGEEGPEVVDFPNRAGIINAANSSVLMRAIDSFAASRGVGGGGSTTNIYLNSTMNAQSVSQADAFGYRLSRQVRGFSS